MWGRHSGMTIVMWGPAAWHTLHTWAHASPITLNDTQKDEMETLLRLFASHLPCPRCRDHFSAYLDAHMDDEALSTRVGLVRMLHEAHNSVNVRTGKRAWTLAEHYKAFARPCASKGVDVSAIVAACAVLGVGAVFVYRKKYCMRPCKVAR